MNIAQLFENWAIPFVSIGSGKLVPREHAEAAICRIYLNNFVFLGYDAFTVRADGTRQPHLEHSAAFSEKMPRTLEEALDSVKDDPAEITHYEFVFQHPA